MDIDQLYKEQCKNELLNTSYPLHPEDWVKYRLDGQLPFEDEKDASFYVHIPFCSKLCHFCEYTRLKVPSTEVQTHYLRALQHDVKQFFNNYQDLVLRGFDIGGGTPTALSEHNFHILLTEIFSPVVNSMHLAEDFEPSIEATFQTLSPSKIADIVSCGIKRVSLGVQSTSVNVLGHYNRDGASVKQMKDTLEELQKQGIKKVNLDLMYGLSGQTESSLKLDIEAISILRPEQVTLYELRPNMLHCRVQTSYLERYNQYCQLYEMLIGMGYNAQFGQNTFSLSLTDMGVSSYLRCRMLGGTSYRGFGLSAQSMSSNGLAYCVGKNGMTLQKTIERDSFTEDNYYKLPPAELVSKYIAISAYSGGFFLSPATRLLGQDASIYFAKQIDYCLSKGLLQQVDDRLQITEKGFIHYGAVFSLFFDKQNVLL